LTLRPLTYRMNDLLEERGFKGRFAALVMLIFNEKTGKCHIINAGDKLLHLYKASQKRMVTIELPESPAAGVFR
jgi:serine phosphatase RsbU (regulator of sigma subunit)